MAVLQWEVVPTGSEGWHFGTGGWDVTYTHSSGATAEFTYTDGVSLRQPCAQPELLRMQLLQRFWCS